MYSRRARTSLAAWQMIRDWWTLRRSRRATRRSLRFESLEARRLLVNSAPTTVGIANVSSPEDTALVSVDIFSAFNDVEDPDNALTYTVTGNSAPSLFTNISVDLVNGLLKFSVAPDANGTSTIQLRATDTGNLFVQTTFQVQITEANDAPTGVNDTLSNVAEDSPQVAFPFSTMTGNDVKGPANEAAQSLQIIAVNNVIGGSAILSGTNVLFTPAANFNGPASFQYTVQDNGTTAGASDPKTSTATASFTVTPVNDTPVAQADTLPAIAEDSIAATIPVSLLLANDSAGPPDETGQSLTVVSVTLATNGTAVLSGTNVLFTPTANFNGNATFLYTVRDNGTTNGVSDPKQFSVMATVPVYEVNDAPAGVNDSLASAPEDSPGVVIPFSQLVANDSRGPINEANQNLTIVVVGSAVNGSVSIQSGNVVFVPALNALGTAQFTYTLQDDGTTNSAADFKTSTTTASFILTNTNDAPVLNNSGNPTFTLVTESQRTNSGDSVLDLVNRVSPIDMITDIDPNSAEGIAVTSVQDNFGQWQFTLNGGQSWQAFGAVLNTQARLLAADGITRIRFVPDATLPGSEQVNITFRAWDRTSGANGAVADVSTNGGMTAFSTATETASLAVQSAFVVSGSTLTITGSGINDQFGLVFADAMNFTVTLNNIIKSYQVPAIQQIVFNAGVGVDATTFTGTHQTETYHFSPAKLEVQGPNYTFTANASETNVVNGEANDAAYFNDSTGNDTFTLNLDSSAMTGPNYSNQFLGSAPATATATLGNDSAVFADDAGNDIFYAFASGPLYVGQNRQAYASGFDLYQATSSAGFDVVLFYDSAGNDTFRGAPSQSSLQNSATLIQTAGFDQSYAFATGGGNDTAYYSDGTGDDFFYGYSTYSAMVTGSVLNEAVGFDQSIATASAGGIDIASLYDSSGNDTFVGTGRVNTFSGTGFSNQSVSFEYVFALTSTGNDTGQISDSPGNEYLNALGDTAVMFYVGYAVQLIGFDQITAQSTLGGIDYRHVGVIDFVLQTTGHWHDA